MLEQCWNWSLEDGSSPGAGLEIPSLNLWSWRTTVLQSLAPTRSNTLAWKFLVKAIAHRVRNFRMCFSVVVFFFFFFCHPLLSKCLLRMRKRRKSNLIRFFYFLWRTKVSEAVCKHDWHNMRSYLFFNVRKFRTRCAMIFSLKTLITLVQVCLIRVVATQWPSRNWIWHPCSKQTCFEVYFVRNYVIAVSSSENPTKLHHDLDVRLTYCSGWTLNLVLLIYRILYTWMPFFSVLCVCRYQPWFHVP